MSLFSGDPETPAMERFPHSLRGPVLVGVDGSDRGEDAIALGRCLGEALGQPLVLVHVAEPAPLGRGAVDFGTRSRERGRVILREAGVGRVACDVDRRLLEGVTASRGLHDLADEAAAGLVVVGSSKHGRIGRILVGSVGEDLLTCSPCTVALAPAGYGARNDLHRPRLIGVGYDDSRESRLALDVALAIATATGGALRLWCAVAPTAARGLPPERYKELTGYAHDIARRQLHHALASVPTEIGATTTVMDGEPAEMIVNEAIREDVDLVVVGSRGHGPLASVLVGSTARKLMRTAPCPVAVVPRPR
jgi:nucleotide-binding universal stress UspA family protein